jgi:putative LysE/RhtB family amino acid efflux pump
VDGLAIGFGLGFLVALQLGPMSLLLVRSTLRSGLPVGVAIGAGVAVVDALYAAAGAAGAASLLQVDALRLLLGLLGAAVLVVLGLGTLRSAVHARAGLEDAREVAGVRRAFLLSLGATASNPLTIASWAAVFAAASVATSAGPVPLVVGVALGSATWMAALACAVAAVRRRIPDGGVRLANAMAGLGMTGFGGALGCRAVGGDG